MMPFRRLLSEIHRRSLWQTLGVYLAGSWVALQVIDILVDSLDLPKWIPAGVILLILIGLPITLVTAFIQAGIAIASETEEVDEPPEPSTPRRPDDLESGEDVEAPLQVRRMFTWRNAMAGGVLAFALWGVVATGWLLLGEGAAMEGNEEGLELDAGVVAVFPFHVTGAGNLDYLAEGMVDLVAAKLTGEGGLRAADPRSVMSVWNRATSGGAEEIRQDVATGLARSLGSGQVLTGGIVGTPSGMVINASVVDVRDGSTRGQASVEGPVDSLTVLVDQLVAQVLAQEAGEEDQRLGALTSTSLQALRAYLDALAAYRQGSYSDADRYFELALQSDSTFALAALGWVASSWWSPGFEKFNRARRAAWVLRDRLSPRDRTLLDSWTGPRYPQASGWAEHLVRWELAIAAAPERPESWYESGDVYFHYGPLLGVDDWVDRAQARFQRASELDPSFAAPVGHLLELTSIKGDRERIKDYQEAYSALDPAGETRSFLEWRAASALGDSEALAAMHRRFPELESTSLNRIIGIAQLYDSTLASAELAASVLGGRVGTRTERWEWLLGLHSLALNRGRPGEALRLLEAWGEVEGSPGESQRIRVLDGLYWDGDPDAAAAAADHLMARADAPLAPPGDLRDAQLADICVAEQWRLRQGDTSTALRSLRRFQESNNPSRVEPTPSPSRGVRSHYRKPSCHCGGPAGCG